MNVYSDFSVQASCPTVVALGCFDGVHLGHRAVLGQAVALAKEFACNSAALSFTEPPKNYFLPHSVSLLTPSEEKILLISEIGIDHLWNVPFDQTICQISAEAFFYDLLLNCLQVKHIVCGFNYTFGEKACGNVTLLEELCLKNGIELTVLPPVSVDTLEVSSSSIRKAITDGRVEDAARALGRPYSLRERVIDGQKLARTLGFPTINQAFPSSLTVPRHGVYASMIRVDGFDTPFYGISNVGTRPTVNGSLLCVETHLFDFEGDLYERQIEVAFLSFLRDEQKFNSLKSLTVQIQSDIQKAKEIIASKSFIC